jgi:hypothetical protein
MMINVSDLKEIGTVPRIHGNGFLQLDLEDGQRLHIWGHPDLPRQKVDTGIHNHRFNFRSEVIIGRIINAIYDPQKITDAPTHALYQPVTRDGEDTVLEAVGAAFKVRLFPPHLQLIQKGSRYSMEGFRYHESFTDRPSATIMTKTNPNNGLLPRVLVPLGVEPDNDFNRNNVMPVEQMWDIIGQVLG